MLYGFTDGPAAQPAGNQLDSHRYRDVDWTVPESTVRVYWWPLRQSGSCLVPPRTQTQSDGPELLLTLQSATSASPNSLNHSLRLHLCVYSIIAWWVHLWVRLIIASECMSKIAQSRPCRVSLSSLNRGLQWHLQTGSITAWKCISKLAWLRPPGASPNLLNRGLHVHPWVQSISVSNYFFKLARSQPESPSPSPLNLSLQVHLHIPSITASECIFEFTRSSF